MGKAVKGRRVYTPDEIHTIEKLLEGGHSPSSIARSVNRTPAAIKTFIYLRRNPDKRQPGPSAGRGKYKRRKKTTGDNTALVEIILGADLPKRKKIAALEALL